MKLSNILVDQNFITFNKLCKLNGIPQIKTTWNNVLGMVERICNTIVNNSVVLFEMTDVWSYTEKEKSEILTFLNGKYLTNYSAAGKFLRTLVRDNKEIMNELDNADEIQQLVNIPSVRQYNKPTNKVLTVAELSDITDICYDLLNEYDSDGYAVYEDIKQKANEIVTYYFDNNLETDITSTKYKNNMIKRITDSIVNRYVMENDFIETL